MERERKDHSKTGTFILGMISGIVVTVLVLVGLAEYFIRNPERAVAKVVDLGVKRVVEKTVESAPRDYIGQRQGDIAKTAQKFADAFSNGRITSADMQILGTKIFSVIADQKITPAEIDELIRLLDRYSKTM